MMSTHSTVVTSFDPLSMCPEIHDIIKTLKDTDINKGLLFTKIFLSYD